MTSTASFIDLKRLCLFFYVIFPFLFYGSLVYFSYPDGYGLSFYGSYFLSFHDALVLLLGHLLLGLIVLFFLKRVGFYLYVNNKKNPYIDVMLLISYYLWQISDYPYLKMLAMPLFLLFFTRNKHFKICFLILIGMALYQLFYTGQRYPIVFVCMLIFLPLLSRYSLLTLTIGSFFALVIMAYVLQPLRSGELPFSSGLQFGYLFSHLNPIYIGSYLSLGLSSEIKLLIAESVPLLKSVLGVDSVINIVSQEGILKSAYETGTRYGSNSSMYFSISGLMVLAVHFILVLIMVRVLNFRWMSNAIILYFVLLGPYFIRRSIGSYFIDIYILLIIGVLLILFMAVVFAGYKRIDNGVGSDEG